MSRRKKSFLFFISVKGFDFFFEKIIDFFVKKLLKTLCKKQSDKLDLQYITILLVLSLKKAMEGLRVVLMAY